MANVPAIQTFLDNVNAAVNSLLVIRDDLNATDRLWPSLDAASKQAIRTQLAADLDAAKTAIAALLVP